MRVGRDRGVDRELRHEPRPEGGDFGQRERAEDAAGELDRRKALRGIVGLSPVMLGYVALPSRLTAIAPFDPRKHVA